MTRALVVLFFVLGGAVLRGDTPENFTNSVGVYNYDTGEWLSNNEYVEFINNTGELVNITGPSLNVNISDGGNTLILLSTQSIVGAGQSGVIGTGVYTVSGVGLASQSYDVQESWGTPPAGTIGTYPAAHVNYITVTAPGPQLTVVAPYSFTNSAHVAHTVRFQEGSFGQTITVPAASTVVGSVSVVSGSVSNADAYSAGSQSPTWTDDSGNVVATDYVPAGATGTDTLPSAVDSFGGGSSGSWVPDGNAEGPGSQTWSGSGVPPDYGTGAYIYSTSSYDGTFSYHRVPGASPTPSPTPSGVPTPTPTPSPGPSPSPSPSPLPLQATPTPAPAPVANPTPPAYSGSAAGFYAAVYQALGDSGNEYSGAGSFDTSALPVGEYDRGHLDDLQPLVDSGLNTLDSTTATFQGGFSAMMNSTMQFPTSLPPVSDLNFGSAAFGPSGTVATSLDVGLGPYSGWINFVRLALVWVLCFFFVLKTVEALRDYFT